MPTELIDENNLSDVESIARSRANLGLLKRPNGHERNAVLASQWTTIPGAVDNDWRSVCWAA